MEPAYGIENKAGQAGAIPMHEPYPQPAQQHAQPPQYNQYNNYPQQTQHSMEQQNQYTGGAPPPVQSPGPQYHQPTPQEHVQPVSHGTPTAQPAQSYFPDPQKGQHTPATTVVGTPGATHPPTSQYQTATPLHALSTGPAPVDCPACGKRELTRVTYESGNTTHGWAALLCFCCCLGCIPYMMKSTKDVNHNCGSCGTLLACVHNSGKVDVLQHR